MKKKYVALLSTITLLFAFVLLMGTGYGVWMASKSDSKDSQLVSDCFRVYYSNTDGDKVLMENIKPIINEEGVELSPYTLTITNVCREEKELRLQLSVLNDNTIDTDALTIMASGDIQKDTILFKNLENAKMLNENIVQSKILGSATVKPNETIRTNVKMWFDERKAPNIDSKLKFVAMFNLIDASTAIKATFAETLLDNEKDIDLKAKPNFTKLSTTAEGLHTQVALDGNHYYFRGVATNNYVRFAYQTWRVVGINPDNSIRLILDKSALYSNYSSKEEYSDYAGIKYMYDDKKVNNVVLNALANWYEQNIKVRGFDKYVVSSNYCNDSTNKVVKYHTYFSGYRRAAELYKPTLNCPNTKEDFGGQYKLKVGLLSVDEVMLAGGVFKKNNTSYYLYNGEYFYTMTPGRNYNYKTTVMMVSNLGAIGEVSPKTKMGIRPVINLDSTVTVSGAGTMNNPYVVDLDE